MAIINISDINVEKLVLELWKKQKVASFFHNMMFAAPSAPSMEEIKLELESGYIDYISGRAIKVDFSDLTKVNTGLYDRDAGASGARTGSPEALGEGAFERIASTLRH